MLPKSLILLTLPFLVSAYPAIPWHKPFAAPSPAPQKIAPPQQQPSQPPQRPQPGFPASKKETSNKSDVFRISEGNSVALFNGIPVDLATGHPIKVTNTNQNPGSGNSKMKSSSNTKAATSPNKNLERRDLREKLGLGFLAAPNVADATLNAQQTFADSSVGRMQMPQNPAGPPPHGNIGQYPHGHPPPPPPPTPQPNIPTNAPQQAQQLPNQQPRQAQPSPNQKKVDSLPQPAPRQVAKFPMPEQPPPAPEGQKQEKPKLDLSKAIADNKEKQGNKWMVYNGKPMKLAGNEKPTKKALSLVADELNSRDDDFEYEEYNGKLVRRQIVELDSLDSQVDMKRRDRNSRAPRLKGQAVDDPLSLIGDHAAGHGPLDADHEDYYTRLAKRHIDDRSSRAPRLKGQAVTEPLSLVGDHAAGHGPLDGKSEHKAPINLGLAEVAGQKHPTESLNLIQDTIFGVGPMDKPSTAPHPPPQSSYRDLDRKENIRPNPHQRKYPARQPLSLVRDAAAGKGPLDQTGTPGLNAKKKGNQRKDEHSSSPRLPGYPPQRRPGSKRSLEDHRRLNLVADHAMGEGPFEHSDAPVIHGDRIGLSTMHPDAQPLNLVADFAAGQGPFEKSRKSPKHRRPMSAFTEAMPLELVMDHAAGNGPLEKRDITEKLGLGMFDFRKSVKAVGNAAQHAAASNEDEYDIVNPDDDVENGNDGEEEDGEDMLNPISSSIGVDAGRVMIADSDDGTADVAQLPNAKSFAIYNGVPVEIDGKQVKNRKMKKPRPAFPRASNNYQKNKNTNFSKRSAIPGADPGKKVSNVNPFQKNPVSSTRGAKPRTKESQMGETKMLNLCGQEKIVRTPRTSEEETVRVLGGENYRICNGRPCGKVGMGPFR
ncbi:hypothetical protein EX30DRAFT_267118 [Ascodesmis nigricans]|uniref:Uncharacterized protein n=1 Tax=Ascodesmis nigricans TaxID=341454 RepID=A0A4S2MHI5_9PEZI|nr:hypothetical protein EX30DRAFT_267118 [Ascodesmis nigricans]